MGRANLGNKFAPCWLQVGLTNSMLKHPPQQLMPKSEKDFMKLVSQRRAPEYTIYTRYDMRSTFTEVIMPSY